MTINELPHHAGWYPDPESAAGDRWWNGSQWTSHTRPDPFVADPIGIAGQPPGAFTADAWSDTDAPPATVAGSVPGGGTNAYDIDGPMELGAPPLPHGIARGWYPDPNGLPAQRWWDGMGWTEHTAPIPAYLPPPPGYAGRGYAQIHAPYGGTTVVMMAPPKSVGVAFVLTFFFGPLGMLYSTVSGALIMLGVLIIGGFFAGILTLGVAWLFWGPMVWVASIIWGCTAASNQQVPRVTNNYQ